MKKIISNTGIGLLELMLTLSIIATLLLAVTKYYGYVVREQRINGALAEIQAIRGAALRWWAMYHSMDSLTLSQLMTRNLLPEKSDINPWNGEITVTKNSLNNVTITFSNVPKAACYRLQRYFIEEQDVKNSVCNVGNSDKSVGEYQLVLNIIG